MSEEKGIFDCQCPYYPECERCNDKREKCLKEACSYGNFFPYICNDCEDKDTCEYAFDDYCTDGDCLVIK